MFCEKCGNEIDDKWSVCPNCGAELKKEKSDGLEKSKVSKKNKVKKPLFKRVWFWILIVIAAVFALAVFGGSGDSSGDGEKSDISAVEKLSQIATLQRDDDAYVFVGNEGCGTAAGWQLRYTEENEAVRFAEPAVEEIFNTLFGDGCLERNDFSYDLDKESARIYLNTEVQEGTLTNISYDFGSEKITAVIDGSGYEATDEFADEIRNTGIFDIMKADVDSFEKLLEENDMTAGTVSGLNYDELTEYLEENGEDVPEIEEEEITLMTLPVTVVNDTGIDIYELYASTVDVDDWEEDILGTDILYAGESFVIDFTYYSDQTEWDFAMADMTGQMIEFYGLDFADCDPAGATLTLEYDGENGYATLE